MATLLQLKCEANSWKEAYTAKSVQITNYIKAKSTLRHIYMIQMCVYNSILAGRLGDCWLAPGETAGWPLGDCWLAPGKAGWPLGRLLLLAALGGCWLGCADSLNWLIFGAADWRVKFEADADFSVPPNWVEMVVRHHESLKLAGNSVEPAGTRCQYGHQCLECNVSAGWKTGFNQFYRNFVDIYHQEKGWCVFSLLFTGRWACI